MKTQYFDQKSADEDDIELLMAKGQGYVPDTCLLGGRLVMLLIKNKEVPCAGCEGPREICKGKPKENENGR